LKTHHTLLLHRSEVTRLLDFDTCVKVVEEAFLLYAKGKALKPGLMHVDSVDGEFHIKAGGLLLGKRLFALKVNGGFFHNRERFGMPNIQGVIVLCDGENGYPLAVMDSGEITMKRTGAAAAVAAKHLARRGSAALPICGCGVQGRIQLQAMSSVLPIRKVYLFDIDKAKAESLAEEMSERSGRSIEATDNLETSVRASDICVTCTPSHRFYLRKEDVAPGTFVAAMGADSPDKQELDPELLKANKVVVDILEQCAEVGELHHALGKGMRREDVHAELGEIIAGKKTGRTSEKEIIIFDATGTALQDVAAAAAVYQKAVLHGAGQTFDFFE
jgi:alanine dehydrogenase